jgi:glyoxylase-like metal-dependent hydrolase (beta-lactamase superfamily II)
VVYTGKGTPCFVIDPGYNPRIFIDYILYNELDIQGILLTHHHYDHVGGVDKIKQYFDCPVLLHREDIDAYRKPVDHMLEDGEELLLGKERVKVIHTPGHTRGSVCFIMGNGKVAFTGDTIFNVDLGRTDLSGGSDAQMINSCKKVISKWARDMFIYPGHGDGCTMKTVRKINREFLDIIGEE